MPEPIKQFKIMVSDEMLRECEGQLAKHIAVNGSCQTVFEKLAFLVLTAEKHAEKITICRHSAQSWRMSDGKMFCEDCGGQIEPMEGDGRYWVKKG